MSMVHPPSEPCGRCGATFSWLLLEDTEMGDIYECENCNNLILVRREENDN